MWKIAGGMREKCGKLLEIAGKLRGNREGVRNLLNPQGTTLVDRWLGLPCTFVLSKLVHRACLLVPLAVNVRLHNSLLLMRQALHNCCRTYPLRSCQKLKPQMAHEGIVEKPKRLQKKYGKLWKIVKYCEILRKRLENSKKLRTSIVQPDCAIMGCSEG